MSACSSWTPPPAEILATPPDFLSRIELGSHLTGSRANGLHAMIRRIKAYAEAFGAAGSSLFDLLTTIAADMRTDPTNVATNNLADLDAGRPIHRVGARAVPRREHQAVDLPS